MQTIEFAFFKDETEFQELVEVLAISENCHYYGIPVEEEVMAFAHSQNPFITDELIERLGAFQPVPINRVKRTIKEYQNTSKLAKQIAKTQLKYWEERALRKKQLPYPLLEEEVELLSHFFLFFCPLVGVTETHLWYSFDVTEEELECI